MHAENFGSDAYETARRIIMTIQKEMSIGQVLKLDRGTAPIFMEFGMHCLGCPHATAESIEQAGMVHGVDVDELVEKLNEYLTSQSQ